MAASARTRRKRNRVDGCHLEDTAQGGEQRAEGVAIGHPGKGAARGDLNALRRIVDEDSGRGLVKRGDQVAAYRR